jgi:hypothetical protein
MRTSNGTSADEAKTTGLASRNQLPVKPLGSRDQLTNFPQSWALWKPLDGQCGECESSVIRWLVVSHVAIAAVCLLASPRTAAYESTKAMKSDRETRRLNVFSDVSTGKMVGGIATEVEK